MDRAAYSQLVNFDLDLGTDYVTGADEAGRGCLAGPLVAAAVTFKYSDLSESELLELSEFNDSKGVSEKKRERLLKVVGRLAKVTTVVSRSAGRIDRDGLHNTNLSALTAAAKQSAVAGSSVVVDGFSLPELKCGHQGLKGGDRTSAAVAAASILAKVTRDQCMFDAAKTYPEWGFDQHKGYGTKQHSEAIEKHGLTPLHRRSFNSSAYSQLTLT